MKKFMTIICHTLQPKLFELRPAGSPVASRFSARLLARGGVR